MRDQRHPGKTRYPLYRRLGGLTADLDGCGKISPPTGIRSPDRPARSDSLYRLSYPGSPSHQFSILLSRTQCVLTQQTATFREPGCLWRLSDVLNLDTGTKQCIYLKINQLDVLNIKFESSLNLCTGRPSIGVMIPETV